MRLLIHALFVLCVASSASLAGSTSPEAEAIATYEAACLASAIHQRAIPEWARLNAVSVQNASEYRNLVYGKFRNVWRTSRTTNRIYVTLDEKLACQVWYHSGNVSSAVENFRRVMQQRRELASSDATVELFRDGEVAPGMYVLSYVIRFKGMDVGLMWSAYASANEVPSAVFYEAARVRLEP